MKATILIATCRRPEQCLETLADIFRNDSKKLIDKILVIENGMKTNLEELLKKSFDPSAVQYLFSSPPNKSLALNLGMQKIIKDEFIIFFDDDVSIFPDTIESYVRAAEKFGPNYFYGGPTFAVYDTHPSDWQLDLLPASVKGFNPSYEFGHTRNDLFFLGFNWAAYKSSLSSTQGFNPNFGPGSLTGSTGQESNMMKQLIDNQIFGLYVPDAKVKHHVSSVSFSAKWIIKRSFRHATETGLTTHRSTFFKTLVNPWHYFPVLKALLKPEVNLKAKLVKTLAMAADRAGILKGLYLREIK
jgi:glycosyltransferase involved in cell wall biosynthesis